VYILNEIYKVEHQAHCFSLRIELVFARNTVVLSKFSSGRNAYFLPNRQYSLVEETHVFLKRKPSMLEGGASTTLFACEH
jgi:hypothetical protein